MRTFDEISTFCLGVRDFFLPLLKFLVSFFPASIHKEPVKTFDEISHFLIFILFRSLMAEVCLILVVLGVYQESAMQSIFCFGHNA